MNETIVAAFVPLVDCAALAVAKEKGFVRGLELVKEPSWASLRDHLNLGYVDCAHALAPLPIASQLGIAQVRAQTFVPFVLGRGGNAITVSKSLAAELRSVRSDANYAGPNTAIALSRMFAARRRGKAEELTFGMVYPFSGHNYELRYWLAEAGIHPDRDVRLVSVPPPLMVESLRAGHIDGFCVGEPWNSLAVAQGLGEIVAYKSRMFPGGIEKVLAVRSAMRAAPAKLQALLEGLFAAAEWADEEDNHAELAVMLSRPEYLNLPARLIAQALSGRVPTGAGEDIDDPDFLYFSRHNASYPDVEQALWIYAQMVRWGQVPQSAHLQSIAMQVFTPRIYFGAGGAEPRVAPPEQEPCVNAGAFGDYLARFDIYTPFVDSVASVES